MLCYMSFPSSLIFTLLSIKAHKPNLLSFQNVYLKCPSSSCPVQVVDYMQKKFSELGSPNKMTVSMGHGAKAWVSDFNHPHYMAGRKAMKTGIPSTNRELFVLIIAIYR